MKNQNKINQFLLFPIYAACMLCLLGLETIKDPTRPPSFVENVTTVTGKATIGIQGLVLTAIYLFPSRPAVIINNQLLYTGDSIGEFTITSINPYTVELMGSDNSKQVLQIVAPVRH